MKLVDYGGRKTHVAAAQHKAYPDIRADGVLEKPAKLFWHGVRSGQAHVRLEHRLVRREERHDRGDA